MRSFELRYSLLGIFFTQRSWKLGKRSLEVCHVIAAEIRRQTRISSQRVSTRDSTHSFEHCERRHHGRVVRRHQGRKIRSWHTVCEQMSKSVRPGLNGVTRLLLATDVDHCHLAALVCCVDHGFHGLFAERGP